MHKVLCQAQTSDLCTFRHPHPSNNDCSNIDRLFPKLVAGAETSSTHLSGPDGVKQYFDTNFTNKAGGAWQVAEVGEAPPVEDSYTEPQMVGAGMVGMDTAVVMVAEAVMVEVAVMEVVVVVVAIKGGSGNGGGGCYGRGIHRNWQGCFWRKLADIEVT